MNDISDRRQTSIKRKELRKVIHELDLEGRIPDQTIDRTSFTHEFAEAVSEYYQHIGAQKTSIMENTNGATRKKLLRDLRNTTEAALRQYAIDDLEKEESRKDDLTGLYTRKRLETDLEFKIGAIERHSNGETDHDTRRLADPTPFSVFYLDIDDFGKFNNEYGHPLGDAVLKTLSGILSKHTNNHAYRHGGDEFFGILSGTPEEAEAAAEEILKEIRASGVMSEEGVINFTASIGLVHYKAGSVEDLIKQADVMMYAGKEHGKDTLYVQPSILD